MYLRIRRPKSSEHKIWRLGSSDQMFKPKNVILYKFNMLSTTASRGRTIDRSMSLMVGQLYIDVVSRPTRGGRPEGFSMDGQTTVGWRRVGPGVQEKRTGRRSSPWIRTRGQHCCTPEAAAARHIVKHNKGRHVDCSDIMAAFSWVSRSGGGHRQKRLPTHENDGAPWTRRRMEPHCKTCSRRTEQFSGRHFTVA